jgi:hypothetical protein
MAKVSLRGVISPKTTGNKYPDRLVRKHLPELDYILGIRPKDLLVTKSFRCSNCNRKFTGRVFRDTFDVSCTFCQPYRTTARVQEDT